MVQRRELAQTLSTQALADSLSETDEQVEKSIKSNRQVQKRAARASKVGDGSGPVADADAKDGPERERSFAESGHPD